ncbi:TetR/AcrR family transcriptional regulator [Kineosporia sp. J2-2]|uniref:TetR/AcrR family transcriptional regulator n=1 Tax=Kineosporia corallincola TaxID=2835133 RepID=A0ABS5TGA3_9ACTN|nr:TetR/AcrR family transcriptional regulator [Kineosporia corallincola]MBT0769409.1 TetR/AcrR family transcriptional regulator [Kineosporia corallincola]
MTATSGQHRPRVRDAGATRADLLRAARRRFSALGYERTTSRDIARDAGVNVSLIYRYFGSKEQLFEVVLEETADLFQRLETQTLEQLVEQFVDGLTGGGTPDPHYGGKHPLLVMLRETSDDSRTSKLRHQTLGAVISHFAEVIARRHHTDPTPQQMAAARLRAGLLFSTFAGVVTLRAAIPGDEFSCAGPDDLRAELTRIATEVVAGPLTPAPELPKRT